MNRRSCFFIGHREASEEIYADLRVAVIEAKERHPEVTLTMLLPYYPTECPITASEGFDSIYYPPGMESVPRRAAIVKANRYMVNHVDYLIAYTWHPESTARDLIDYARTKEEKYSIRIRNIPHS